MQFCGNKLDKKDFFGKSDPFLVFYRSNEDGTWVPSPPPSFTLLPSSLLSCLIQSFPAAKGNWFHWFTPKLKTACLGMCVNDMWKQEMWYLHQSAGTLFHLAACDNEIRPYKTEVLLQAWGLMKWPLYSVCGSGQQRPQKGNQSSCLFLFFLSICVSPLNLHYPSFISFP